MIFLRYLLLWGGAGMLAAAAAILAHDFYLSAKHKQALATAGASPAPEAPTIHWRNAIVIAALAWVSILLSCGIVVVPSGMAGVCVSQTSGTLPGTLYPGAHFITPLADNVVLFDTRDQLFTTGELESSAKEPKADAAEPLRVQAEEGLTVGLAITVRYRLDPKHLDYIQANLPQPIEKEIVPAVVASAWRELVPYYTVRDVFATRREEIRQKASDQITQKLAADGIVVKEVMLRDIQLPPEYAKCLESLLLKEQQNDQAKLEAEARKDATVKNAEAEAEAKVIDSKAEMERRKMLSEAEADRIRVTSIADVERMRNEGAVLKQNPLLINKIVAEKLSDKLQIMMVPSDGKFFFANDVLKSVNMSNHADQAEEPEK